jgi:hypothetical protein
LTKWTFITANLSADPPYSILEVIGCAASDDMRQELQQYGFGISEITKEGFIATRTEEAQQGRCT